MRRSWLIMLGGFIAHLGAFASAQLPHPLDVEQVGDTIAGVRILYSIAIETKNGTPVSGIGDINGDGMEDIVIGDPGFSSASHWSEGASTVLFGSTEVIGRSNALILSLIDETEGHRFMGGNQVQILGCHVSGVGDPDGDGLIDFLVGDSQAGPVPSGHGHLILGSGLRGRPFLERPVPHLGADDIVDFVRPHLDSLYILRVDMSGSGDVNGDGFDDMLATATDYTSTGTETYLIFGGADMKNQIEPFDLSLETPTRCTRLDAHLELQSDGSAGVGDVNGDGFDDLLIGTYDNEIFPNPEIIRAHLVYGSPDGIGAGGVLDLETLDGVIGVTFFIDYPNGGGCWPTVSGAGDVDGDGLCDFLISGTEFDVGGPVVSHLVWGSSTGWGADGLMDLADMEASEELHIIADYHTSAVGAGDANGDGYADILIGSEAGATGGVIWGSESLRTSGGTFDFRNADGKNAIWIEGFDAFHISTAGDFNGDGLSDIIMGLPGYYLAALAESTFANAVLICGAGSSEQAVYRTHIHSGDAPARGVGMIGDGSHSIPFSRCWIDHRDGQGPGVADASLETVTLTRTNASIESLASPELMANVMWTLTTDRVSQESTFVRFHFITSEIASLEEADLRLFHSSDPAGPWEPVLPMGLNTQRNEIGGRVTTLTSSPEHFAVAATGGSLGVDPDAVLDYLLGLTDDPIDLDVNIDHDVDVADLTTLVLTDIAPPTTR